MFRTLVRNMTANWVGFAFHVGITFFLTPFVLKSLGDVRYGVWALATSIVGYYGLLDFGFRSGVTQYLARYLAVGDHDKLNKTASSACFVLLLVGVVAIPISFVVAFAAPRLFDLPPALSSETFWCVLILGCSAALQLPFFPFSAATAATQRYDVANAINVVIRVLSAVAIVIALGKGYGLVGITFVTALANLLSYVLYWRAAHALIPSLRVKRSLVNLESFREILSFSLWNFLIAVSDLVLFHTDLLIIGLFLPIELVATYALAFNVVRYLMQLSGQLGRVFFPAATQLHAQERTETLQRLYLDGSRVLFMATVVMAAISASWAPEFYRLWIGPQYAWSGQQPSVAMLYRILAVAVVLNYVPGVGGQILLATRAVRPLATLSFARAVTNLILSIALVQFYGLLGVAVATLCSNLIYRAIVLPIVVARELDVGLARYFVDSLLRPILLGCLLTVAFAVMRRMVPALEWHQLAMSGLLAATLAGGLAFAICLKQQERERLVLRPLAAIAHRIRRS